MLIGLTGPAGCGKDAVAGIIRNRCPGVEQYAFADPIRRALQAMFRRADERTVAALMSPELKESPLPRIGASPRRLMQTLGTEWGREIVDGDLWVILAEQYLQSSPGVDFVISDVRFVNEAVMIRKNGVEVWRIAGRAKDVEAHQSEAGIPETYISDVIDNSGSLTDLELAVNQRLDGRRSANA